LRGILGRLGDLGKIDKKYDVAISTACGFLDHILVQTVHDGEKCINYLRANRIGSARFLMMD
jgi:structural maintenance of chromosome 4